MANSDLKAKITIDADTKDAELGLKNTASNLDSVSKSTANSTNAFSAYGKVISLINSPLVSAAKSAYDFAKETLNLTAEIEGASVSNESFVDSIKQNRNEVTISLSAFKKLSDYLKSINFPIPEVIKFTEKLSDLKIKLGMGGAKPIVFNDVVDGAKEAAAAIGVVSDAVADYYSSEYADIKDEFATSAAMTAAVIADSAVSMQAAIELEKQYNDASRTINGTAQELSDLEDRLQAVSTEQLAVPIEQLYQVAGVAGAMGKTANEVDGFVQRVSEAAVALNIPVDSLAEKFGTVQTQLGNTDDQMTTLMDKINAVADSMPGKVSELDIFTVLSTGVATAAKSFGLLQGETVSLVGSLLSLGEAPETARTAIISLLSSLQNAKNQTPAFQVALGQLGTSADKLAEDIKAKPMETLQGLLGKMHELGSAGRLDIATKLLGTGGDSIALSKLVDNVGLLKSGIETTSNAEKYAGSVHEAYASSIETADAKITMLFNAIKEQAASTMMPILPIFKAVVGGLTDFINWLRTGKDTFSGLTEILSQSIIFWAASAGMISATGRALGILKDFYTVCSSQIGLFAVKIYDSIVALKLKTAALWQNILAVIQSNNTTNQANIATNLWGSGLTGLKNALISAKNAVVGFLGPVGLWGIAITTLVTSMFYLGEKTVEFGDKTVKVKEIVGAVFQTIADYFQSAADRILNSDFLKYAIWVGVITGAWELVAAFGGIGAALVAVSGIITTTVVPALTAALAPALAFIATPIGAIVVGFAVMLAAVEGAIYASTGEVASFGGLMESVGVGIEESINSIVRGYLMMAASIAKMARGIGIEIDFVKEAFSAMFTDSSVEDAQKKRQAALLANEQQFSDDMAIIQTDSSFTSDFKQSVKEKLGVGEKTVAEDKRGADSGKTPDAAAAGDKEVAAAKKLRDDLEKSRKEERDAEIKAIKAAEDDKIAALQLSANSQKKIEDETFKAKLETAKKTGDALKLQLIEEKTALENLTTEKRKNVSNENDPKNKISLQDKFVDFEKEAKDKFAVLEMRKKLIDAAQKGEESRPALSATTGNKATEEIAKAEAARKSAALAKIQDDRDGLAAEIKTVNESLIAKRKALSEELIARKAALTDIQNATRANFQSLMGLAKEHHDKAIALDKDIASVKKQGQDGLREIARAGMTDAQVAADKQVEIDEKTSQVRDLISKKDYANAAAAGKELNALALEQAKSKATAAKNGSGYRSDSMVAQYDYEQSIKLTTQALEAQKAEEAAKAEEARAQAEAQRVAYENVGKQIGALNETLKTGSELKVIVDTKEVDVLRQKLDEIPKDLIIDVKWSKAGTPTFSDSSIQSKNKGGFIESVKRFAFGGHVPGTGDGDTVPAMLTPGEFVITKKAAQKLGAKFLQTLNATGNADHFADGGFVMPSFVSPSVLQASAMGAQAKEQAQSKVTETIAVDLGFGGHRAMATFKRDDSTATLLDALKRAKQTGGR